MHAYRNLCNVKLLKNIRYLYTSSRASKHSYDGPVKTTLTILNSTVSDLILVNSCQPHGFTLNSGPLLIGPTALFSDCALYWNVATALDINEASLSLFSIIEPKIDLLVVGLEKPYEYEVIKRIQDILRNFRISSEVLPVRQAYPIYNFLVEDGRHVAAALIPPIAEKRIIGTPSKNKSNAITFTIDDKGE